MSLSSLPDIFKRSQTVQIRASKQGPAFSLHLNTLSPQKYQPSHAGYAPDENRHVTLGSSKMRAMSTHQVKSKQATLRELTARRKGEGTGKIKVSFREDMELANTAPLRQKIGMSVMNFSNFPYENSRRFNNNTIDLEETDNLSNKLEGLSKQAYGLQSTLQKIKDENSQCKKTFFYFCQNLSEDLQSFSESFQKTLKQCYSTLSSLRRETNEQVKANKVDFEKLKGDMNVCTSFTNDLKQKTNQMVAEYVKTPESHDGDFKADGLYLDFEEISSIRKSSRGATGDISRRTKRNGLPLTSNRKSDDLKLTSARNNQFVLNGKEIEVLNFQIQG